jgi:hypothetical protein
MADLNQVANGTSHEGLTKPVTYGDVFGASGKIGEEAVTEEDAALMQSAETVTLGKTQKGGAAATMQAAAQLNVSEGLVDKDAHSSVAEEGVSVVEMLIPGTRMMKIVWQRESDPSRSVVRDVLRSFVAPWHFLDWNRAVAATASELRSDPRKTALARNVTDPIPLISRACRCSCRCTNRYGIPGRAAGDGSGEAIADRSSHCFRGSCDYWRGRQCMHSVGAVPEYFPRVAKSS